MEQEEKTAKSGIYLDCNPMYKPWRIRLSLDWSDKYDQMCERDTIYTDLHRVRIEEQIERMTCSLKHRRLCMTRRWKNAIVKYVQSMCIP